MGAGRASAHQRGRRRGACRAARDGQRRGARRRLVQRRCGLRRRRCSPGWSAAAGAAAAAGVLRMRVAPAGRFPALEGLAARGHSAGGRAGQPEAGVGAVLWVVGASQRRAGHLGTGRLKSRLKREVRRAGSAPGISKRRRCGRTVRKRSRSTGHAAPQCSPGPPPLPLAKHPPRPT